MTTIISSTDDTVQVDQLHPWLGLASFSEETRNYFYGREDEVGELARRVQRKLLTVLFGQSGLGKTSILRAGIVPRLRKEGYCPVYVRIDYGPDAPSAQQQIKQAIMRETAQSGNWTRLGVALPDEALWEFLHHRDDILEDANGKPLIPLLIFDQFEEIFTLAQGDADGKKRASEFLEGLAELVENRPSKALEARLDVDDSAADRFDFARSDYRVLITLREDYLAHLESLKADMPSITQNRMRLAPMTGRQALAAVTGPGGKLVTDEVAEAIVRFVAGGAELANAQVEPSLLSLICRELNDKRIAAGRNEISLDLLVGSYDSILSDFYERSLADQPQAVRSVIEDVLLTDSGYRENVAEERVLSALGHAGATPDAATVLALLVNRRLLRIEDRLDIRRVELTHDVLCSVVKASRALRQEREERAVTERKLSEQREREKATRKSLIRARQIAVVCLALTIVSVVSGIFGYFKMKQADETRALAETSRGGAEKLVGYLLDDFYVELEPIGRLDTVGELATRTVRYYDNLPAEMRTAETEKNRARALLRLGRVEQLEGRVEEALKNLKQVEAILVPTLKDKSAAMTDVLTLANALNFNGEILYNSGDHEGANDLYLRSTSLSEPYALKQDSSAAARLTYAAALTRVGYVKLRNYDTDAARADFMAVRNLFPDAAERRSNIPLNIAYLKAGQWMVETYVRGSVQDFDAAEKLALNVIDGANDVLHQRPTHWPAAQIEGSTNFMRGYNAVMQRYPGKALGIYDQMNEKENQYRLIDPDNEHTVNGLAIYYDQKSLALGLLGRRSESLETNEKVWDLYKRAKPDAFQARNLYFAGMLMSKILAQEGRSKKLDEMRAHMMENGNRVVKSSEPELAEAYSEGMIVDDLEIRELLNDPTVTAVLLDKLNQRCVRFREKSKNQLAINLSKKANATLERIRFRMAYAGGDYVQAEASARRAIQLDEKTEKFQSQESEINLALALARLHRLPEAKELLKTSLADQRARIAAGSDDQLLRLELAEALFALALTEPNAGAAELHEAAALIAHLPVAMQQDHDVQLWRGRINDELRLNTRAKAAPHTAS